MGECHGMMSRCHDVKISWCQDVKMSICHDVMMSWCHDVMTSWPSADLCRVCIRQGPVLNDYCSYFSRFCDLYVEANLQGNFTTKIPFLASIMHWASSPIMHRPSGTIKYWPSSPISFVDTQPGSINRARLSIRAFLSVWPSPKGRQRHTLKPTQTVYNIGLDWFWITRTKAWTTVKIITVLKTFTNRLLIYNAFFMD